MHEASAPSLLPSIPPSLLQQPVAQPLCPRPPCDFPQGLVQLCVPTADVPSISASSPLLPFLTSPPSPSSTLLPRQALLAVQMADGTGSRVETKRDRLSWRAGRRRERDKESVLTTVCHTFPFLFFYYHNVGAFITVSVEELGERRIL